MYTHKEAIEIIERAFPALSEELRDEVANGLLYVQVGEFARWAQTLIDTGRQKEWAVVTCTFMDLWKNADAAVKNALNVSFLEHLNFVDGKARRQWAFAAMPVPMQMAWREMEAYNRRLHGG